MIIWRWWLFNYHEIPMRLLSTILYLALGLCLGASQPQPPDLLFYDLDDIPRRPLQPSNEKLGAVLLFYWHDCPVCNSYAPEIARMSNSYTNFSFFIVQVDPDLTKPIAKKHATEYNLKASVLLDPLIASLNGLKPASHRKPSL